MSRLRSVLIGAGAVGAGMATDEKMARFFPYATHAQVLSKHPGFEWVGVIDSNSATLEGVSRQWGVPALGNDLSALRGARAEVLVVATPPSRRAELFEGLRSYAPEVRGVLLEKPLAYTEAETASLVEQAERWGGVVCVNYWRRADPLFRRLAAGELAERIGRVQAANIFYGNGLLNNGAHLIDFAIMLLGDVESVRALSTGHPAGPIVGDVQFPFCMLMKSGVCVVGQALDFTAYRENGVDLWGTDGRLAILVEGLVISAYPSVPSRSTTGAQEIAFDAPAALEPTVGEAFFEMYGNLAKSIAQRVQPWSSLASALRTDEIIRALRRSASSGGAAERARS